MLVVFFVVQNSDFGIFRVFWIISCRNEILVFLGSAQFQYRVEMKNFREVFSKLAKIVRQTAVSLKSVSTQVVHEYDLVKLDGKLDIF